MKLTELKKRLIGKSLFINGECEGIIFRIKEYKILNKSFYGVCPQFKGHNVCAYEPMFEEDDMSILCKGKAIRRHGNVFGIN